MNELLLDRASGGLGQNAFARLYYTQLLHAFRPAPHLRFDGGERGTNIAVDDDGGPSSAAAAPAVGQRVGGRDMWAHQAGVNALALERFDGRM